MKKSPLSSPCLPALAATFAIAFIAMPATSALAQTTAGKADSAALFMQMHKVLSHPRCVNCHPKDDTPKQGLDQHVHSPPMTRGDKNEGPAGLPCRACHGEANFDPGRVPGAPNWHLAPASMAWEGKTASELCRAMTDRSRNGNRSLQATVKHLTEDKLVAWGWEPGVDVYGKPREAVPVDKAEFNRLVIAWANSGGACPD